MDTYSFPVTRKGLLHSIAPSIFLAVPSIVTTRCSYIHVFQHKLLFTFDGSVTSSVLEFVLVLTWI